MNLFILNNKAERDHRSIYKTFSEGTDFPIYDYDDKQIRTNPDLQIIAPGDLVLIFGKARTIQNIYRLTNRKYLHAEDIHRKVFVLFGQMFGKLPQPVVYSDFISGNELNCSRVNEVNNFTVGMLVTRCNCNQQKLARLVAEWRANVLASPSFSNHPSEPGKQCPLCNRTYNDGTYVFCLEDGTPLSPVRDADATLVMSTVVDIPLDETQLSPDSSAVIRIDDPVVAICINQQFIHCKTADELYQCTRGLWRLSKSRAERARYALAVYKGEIKEVYAIDCWLDVTKRFSEFWVARLRHQGRIIDPKEHIGRLEFIGKVAPDEVRSKYVGKTLPTRHAQNPILYFNC